MSTIFSIKKDKWLFAIKVCGVFTICMACIFYFAYIPLADDDIFFHLAAGRDLVKNLNFSFIDHWTSTFTGQVWISWSFLFGPLIYSIYSLFGNLGFLFYKLSSLTILAGLIFWEYSVRGQKLLKGFSILIIFFTAMQIRMMYRAELIAFIFFYLLYKKLYSYLPKKKISFKDFIYIYVLFFVWNNYQTTSLFGYALLGNFVLVFFIRNGFMQSRKLIFLVAIALLISIVHPNGYHLHMSLYYGILLQQYLKVGEYDIAPLDDALLIYLTMIIVSYLFLSWIQNEDKQKYKRLLRPRSLFVNLNYLVFSTTAIIGIRMVPFFLIVSLPLFSIILEGINLKKKEIVAYVVSFLVVWLMIGIIIKKTEFDYYIKSRIAPKELVDFIENNPPPGLLFNSFSSGSYLLWRFDGKPKVFWDIRSDVNYKIAEDIARAKSWGENYFYDYLYKQGVCNIAYEYWWEYTKPRHQSYQIEQYPSSRYAVVYLDKYYVLLVDRNCKSANLYIKEYEIVDPQYKRYWHLQMKENVDTR